MPNDIIIIIIIRYKLQTILYTKSGCGKLMFEHNAYITECTFQFDKFKNNLFNNNGFGKKSITEALKITQ